MKVVAELGCVQNLNYASFMEIKEGFIEEN